MKRILAILSISVMMFSCSQKKNVVKGDSNFGNSRYKEAIFHYKEAKGSGAQPGDVEKKLAESYTGLGKYSEATDYYKVYIKKAKKPSKGDYYNYIQCLRATGDVATMDKVIAKYKKAYGDDVSDRLDNVDWLRNVDRGGSYVLSKTVLKTGSRFYGLNFYNYKLHYAMPNGLEFDDYTANYKTVTSVKIKGSYTNLTDGKDVKALKSLKSDVYNGPISFANGGAKVYFSADASVKSSSNRKSLGGAYFGNGAQVIKTGNVKGDKIARIKPLSFCKPGSSYTHPFILEETNTLYFVSDMAGGYGGFDIYKSTLVSGKWTKPENLGDKINTDQNEMYPFFQNGEMYFSSFGHVGYGGSDVYVSFVVNGEFTEALNLGKQVNTQYNDAGLVFVDAENRSGYLASNRGSSKGYDEIYHVSKKYPDDLNVVIKPIGGELENNVPVELWRKDGNKYVMIDTKVAEEGGVMFLLDKGITYKVKVKNGGLNEAIEKKLSPASRFVQVATDFPITVHFGEKYKITEEQRLADLARRKEVSDAKRKANEERLNKQNKSKTKVTAVETKKEEVLNNNTYEDYYSNNTDEASDVKKTKPVTKKVVVANKKTKTKVKAKVKTKSSRKATNKAGYSTLSDDEVYIVGGVFGSIRNAKIGLRKMKENHGIESAKIYFNQYTNLYYLSLYNGRTQSSAISKLTALKDDDYEGVFDKAWIYVKRN
ncbi:MAG: hypothetical protein KAG96_02515 [Ichthyobacteriaceae bacterium]|nr:hypothetical protein [Ichthyobacteriaceae bacterium]